ncbi:MAG: hypothetical protein JJ971_01960 [Balneolaceae bacterium]|nr:hypothetical protein [Balneolaceae bacterium]MBO6545137.1 hypothetical protein [Balneolaceae bacterium]MBO6646533.1 hypothetical protein [Balneolaceae bacterium]
MKKWKQRVKEEANLLNPAFLNVLFISAIKGYQEKNGEGLPYLYLFLIPPIVLHKSTRELLPRTIRTSLFTWLYENQKVKVSFFKRVASLKPFIQEAILFGVRANAIEIKENGMIISQTPSNAINKIFRTETEETKKCINEAKFLGKWFAGAGDVKTVLSLWGIRP